MALPSLVSWPPTRPARTVSAICGARTRRRSELGKGAQPTEGRSMKVGVPREVKNREYRVAITPAGVHELVRHGHEVVIEASAGAGSSIPDEDFTAAGAKMLPNADDGWQNADLGLHGT